MLMAKEKDGKVQSGKSRAGREESSPRKKRSKLVLIFLFLILLAGGGAGAYFFAGDRILEHYIMNSAADRSLARKAAAVEAKRGSSEGPILTLDPFIFNLAGNSSRFAKVSLAISLQNNAAFEEAKKIVPIMRDKALMVLSGKSAEELIDVTKRDSIKRELQMGLRDVFKEKEDLESVYITDIIIP
jgi:flagellar FliL protein